MHRSQSQLHLSRNQGHLQGPAHGSVTGYRCVPGDSEQAPMLAVARQPVSAATTADQSSFQSYRSGVHGNRLDCKSLLDCVVFGRVTGVACARYVLGDNTKAASLAKCMEVPESCSTGVDEMREMASEIKTEVRGELNATRKRLHQIASDFVSCNALTSQVSSYRSTFRAKVKSHTSCRKQQQAENGVSMTCTKFLSAMKVNRTLLCERGSLTADVADLMPICTHSAKETLGM